MGGTREGGQLAAQKNKATYGEKFYAEIGALGGAKSRGGGFGEGDIGKERARFFGAIGGSMSRKDNSLTQAERNAIKQRLFDQYSDALERLTQVQQAARERRAKNA
jgi:hypothetical protein